ncbi:MAG: hypothetical protein CO137_03810 [Candidatus Magasanikbacteria bacterium CG_4_9_14_3_um_filter_32_9]|uniref:Uncharacterized protein n=1 Tax=Candidatus Magasanikbacteria bacterium CG_4_9_14_3_um_filter_32_9 TaxID=1974644 RepID=A0A2M7Z5U6_9BACT|nr:MAG: hypothetical protein CO137_03810 [Candidatus Magasanikbacteria bacterium CG_4_9_14_3_um_filter_32_9]
MKTFFKKYKNIALVVVLMLFVMGNIIPFFFHEDFYIGYRRNPLTTIDMKSELLNKIGFDSSQPYPDTILYCVQFNLSDNVLPVSSLEKLLLLRKITVINKTEQNQYELELKTIFNIKYRENIITEPLDPLLINKGCRI